MPKGVYIRSEKSKAKLRTMRIGKYPSEETKKRMSLAKKGKIPKNIKWLSSWNIGKHPSEEIRKKYRLAAFEYAQKVCAISFPRIGHNEKQILDKLELKLNYKILRQYKAEGYFIDGYIPELKLAIEVDEKRHNQNVKKEKDIHRQKIIENKLRCKFIRING